MPLTPFWNDGRVKNSDTPPPVANGDTWVEPVQNLVNAWLKVSFHATEVKLPSPFCSSSVPPTAVTSGSGVYQS